jgi:prepilin-type N-terminal cleavage/methylation domain-containing protein
LTTAFGVGKLSEVLFRRRPDMTASYPRPRGFTMLELAVVIVIIGVLLGLLFPAIHRVRNSAFRLQDL